MCKYKGKVYVNYVSIKYCHLDKFLFTFSNKK